MKEFWELNEKYYSKKFETSKQIVADVENHIAGIRIRTAVDKMHPVRLQFNEVNAADPTFGVEAGFEPFSMNDHEAKNDLKLP